MQYTPHDYQLAFLQDAVAFVRAILDATWEGNKRRLYSSPTGTGKSIMLLLAQQQLGSNVWIVTPRVEILKGMLEKLGCDTEGWGEERVVKEAWKRRMTTPIRLRNAQLRGDGPEIDGLLIDEAHHDNADTYQQVHLMTDTWAIGVTASPYRGTPAGTRALREAWGEPVPVLTMREAIERGVLAFPRCEVLPLVDDDLIEVSNGEFVASSVSETTGSRLADLVNHCRRYVKALRWDRATMFAAPNTETAESLTVMLRTAGLPATCITQASSRRERDKAFVDVVSRHEALVQINVVSEGVDLPIRRLIDLAPMLSPVRWLQQLGRITRPSDTPPHYLCTNRNLLRHAYLLEGLLPVAEAVAAEKAFKVPSKRGGARAVGLEAVGKLKAGEMPLSCGLTGHVYAMSSVTGGTVTEYACLVHPLKEDVTWARRERPKQEYGAAKIDYGRWVACPPPEGLTGFASVPAKAPSEKQKAWWKKCAAGRGLDPDAKLTAKNFIALPVLSDLRTRI